MHAYEDLKLEMQTLDKFIHGLRGHLILAENDLNKLRIYLDLPLLDPHTIATANAYIRRRQGRAIRYARETLKGISNIVTYLETNVVKTNTRLEPFELQFGPALFVRTRGAFGKLEVLVVEVWELFSRVKNMVDLVEAVILGCGEDEE